MQKRALSNANNKYNLCKNNNNDKNNSNNSNGNINHNNDDDDNNELCRAHDMAVFKPWSFVFGTCIGIRMKTCKYFAGAAQLALTWFRKVGVMCFEQCLMLLLRSKVHNM